MWLKGNLVDVVARRIFPAHMLVENGRIAKILEVGDSFDTYILPGFVDAHVHIESSTLIPSQFARLAVRQGTVATVSDPHEIANVLGTDGVRFMIEDGRRVPFKFAWGAPSCVPATGFETSGAILDVRDVEQLLELPDVYYLSEMMNVPGVLNGDPAVLAKIAAAQRLGKPVDGHSPGLTGEDVRNYIAAGMSTDHECLSYEEALFKIRCGMHVIVREGSAARNFDELIPLIGLSPDKIMFCSDDKHPDELHEGHINVLVRRAIQKGYQVMDVLRAATVNPVRHYRLPVGLLQIGDPADFIVLDNLSDFNVLSTYIDGQEMAQNGWSHIESLRARPANRFNSRTLTVEDLHVPVAGEQMRVIQVQDGSLETFEQIVEPTVSDGAAIQDVRRDLSKLVVLNRYQIARPSVAFVSGFGLKRGAIASTHAHDSHNIIAVGATDEDLVAAINLVVEARGGLAVVSGDDRHIYPLPIAGLMTDTGAFQAFPQYAALTQRARELGTELHAPFTTLSFLALLVIPELKLSDKGLFDGRSFQFTSLFC